MPKSPPAEVLITGLGVVSAIGVGVPRFAQAIFAGASAFATMRRPGRQLPGSDFIGAEIDDDALAAAPGTASARRASLTVRAALAAAYEAHEDAGLIAFDRERIGLVVGGSNLSQREHELMRDAYRERPFFVPPSYASAYMDSDVAGWCGEALAIRGGGCSLGGASASGALAVIHAARMVASGELDACIAIGALADLSFWECQAFRSLGAMGSDRDADAPERAGRPFDRERDGFVYGEACAAIVVESASSAMRRGQAAHIRIAGWGVAGDANRHPNPSLEGECRAIARALEHASWRADQIDYVNPHGSGSVVGDETELQALQDSGLSGAWLNATKALTGHGLSAAGAVEIVATAIQMRASRLHPNRNLAQPMGEARWVGPEAQKNTIARALKLSLGFGGINTAICLERGQDAFTYSEIEHAGWN